MGGAGWGACRSAGGAGRWVVPPVGGVTGRFWVRWIKG